ncbi:hypothetical protein Q7C36_001363 [Tachysurus vachellii]|uniref:Uncharacterized protein n=1 Tax=Tachysurus vachellii TaxID=175792 RepID=A0AA88T900_TACVA|nr:hypothetical protein Q7C36_001363 [Tachysurus vachellii]
MNARPERRAEARATIGAFNQRALVKGEPRCCCCLAASVCRAHMGPRTLSSFVLERAKVWGPIG